MKKPSPKAHVDGPPAEYFFREGCFIQEWLNDPQTPDMSVARVRVEAGKTTRLHHLLSSAERYLMLQGTAVAQVGDEQYELAVGDVLTIGAGQAQRVHNPGSDDLVFLAICTPRFTEQDYVDLDEADPLD